MNLQSLTPTRIFTRGKRTSEPKPERVERMPLQERLIQAIPAEAQADSSNDAVLAETIRAGCQRASAGMTVFVP